MSFKKLILSYDHKLSTWQNVFHFLEIARKEEKEGPFVHHMVASTLKLRFPETKINNDTYDASKAKPCDFYIGDTAFHVTVAPMPAVYEKCRSNIQEGLRVYLLVPDRSLSGARQNSALLLEGRMAVESIESFVSQNIEEISAFSKEKLPDGFRKLIEEYNKRVNETEVDKSFMIEVPRNL
jgi:hypothetical protein